MKTKNKIMIIIILLLLLILLLLMPIVVFANNLFFPRVVEYNDNIRELELEKIEKSKNTSTSQIENPYEIENLIEDEEEVRKAEISRQESIEKDNRILKIVEKYASKQMQEIYDELNGNSIYDVNLELEYKFDNIILDIIETKEIQEEEKEELIDYMYGEYGNVKENKDLYNRIEQVCK